MFDLNPEAATLAKARVLGVRLPEWRMCEYPALFSAWADRVTIADIARSRGKLTDGDKAACDVLISLPAILPPMASADPGKSIVGFANVFRMDPMAGIAEPVRAFSGAGR